MKNAQKFHINTGKISRNNKFILTNLYARDNNRFSAKLKGTENVVKKQENTGKERGNA